MENTKNIIFLDIDGILVNIRNYKAIKNFPQFEEEWINNLKEIINETNSYIVISSTWRTSGLKKLKSVFHSYGIEKERILDITPIGKPFQFKSRWEEIKEWLSKNECDNYAIIDDNDVGTINENFFMTYGITDILKNKVICFLEKKN
jgi:hypothetical protein